MSDLTTQALAGKGPVEGQSLVQEPKPIVHLQAGVATGQKKPGRGRLKIPLLGLQLAFVRSSEG